MRGAKPPWFGALPLHLQDAVLWLYTGTRRSFGEEAARLSWDQIGRGMEAE